MDRCHILCADNMKMIPVHHPVNKLLIPCLQIRSLGPADHHLQVRILPDALSQRHRQPSLHGIQKQIPAIASHIRAVFSHIKNLLLNRAEGVLNTRRLPPAGRCKMDPLFLLQIRDQLKQPGVHLVLPVRHQRSVNVCHN